MADLHLDLFAGPGGWSEAMRSLGLREIGLEWDAAACRTRAAVGHATIQCDVTAYPTEPFRGRIVGKIASPTCTPWSRAGKGLGLVDQPLVHQCVHDLARGRDTRAALLAACKDERSLLAAEPMRWLHDLRPEWTAMEQVPDVLPLWKQYAEILRGWGYSVWAGVLNAADYGVPQTRRRAILIASRVRSVTAPPPTHTQHPMGDDLFGESLPGWVTMAAALGWDSGLMVNTRGDRKTAGGNDFPADGPSWALMEKTRSWALRNGNQPNAAVRPADEPAPTIAFGNNAARVEWVVRTSFGTPSADSRNGTHELNPFERPAHAVTTKAEDWVMERPATTVCSTDRIAPPGHRDRSPSGESHFAGPGTVRITQAEAAVLQSFPADYPWQGSKTKQFEQIGNAVPPLLALHVIAAAAGVAVPGAEEVAA